MLKRISVLSFFCLAMSVAALAFALDWNDEDWLKAGCPGDIAGKWMLRGDATASNQTLTVQSNQIKFTSEAGDQKVIAFSQDARSNGPIILELNDSDLSGVRETLPYPPYWKVRPHLVMGHASSDNELAEWSPCLIKVFRYRYQDQIAADKYVSWDIYFIK